MAINQNPTNWWDMINLYIQSICDEMFDINHIEKCDIYQFIRLIDQYPTTTLSIDQIEKQIIRFFLKNDIKFDNLMKDICERYRLKSMYLYIHNQNF